MLAEDGEGSLAILEPTVISACDASKQMYLNQGVLFLCADGLTKLQKIGIPIHLIFPNFSLFYIDSELKESLMYPFFFYSC